MTVALPFLCQSGVGLSTTEPICTFSGVQQLISCFKCKVVLIKYARLTSECMRWGSPLFTSQKQPAWTSLAILHQEAPPDSPLPSLAAGPATYAQAQLKQRHPVKYELAPKSTRTARTAPHQVRNPAECC